MSASFQQLPLLHREETADKPRAAPRRLALLRARSTARRADIASIEFASTLPVGRPLDLNGSYATVRAHDLFHRLTPHEETVAGERRFTRLRRDRHSA